MCIVNEHLGSPQHCEVQARDFSHIPPDKEICHHLDSLPRRQRKHGHKRISVQLWISQGALPLEQPHPIFHGGRVCTSSLGLIFPETTQSPCCFVAAVFLFMILTPKPSKPYRFVKINFNFINLIFSLEPTTISPFHL